jgi:hypothetical protein
MISFATAAAAVVLKQAGDVSELKAKMFPQDQTFVSMITSPPPSHHQQQQISQPHTTTRRKS